MIKFIYRELLHKYTMNIDKSIVICMGEDRGEAEYILSLFEIISLYDDLPVIVASSNGATNTTLIMKYSHHTIISIYDDDLNLSNITHWIKSRKLF